MDNKVLDLLEIRDQIDGIDKEIVELFEKRMQLSAEVAEYKISNNKAVLDPQREKEKLNTLEKYASNSFNRVGVYELFRQMMAMSRKLQYRILAEKGKAEKIPFRKVSSLPMQKAKVVFQGVEGAYSFTAMHSFFGESIENYNVETWRDAMEAIKNGEELGVLSQNPYAMGYQTMWAAIQSTAPKKETKIEKQVLLDPAWIDAENLGSEDYANYMYN